MKKEFKLNEFRTKTGIGKWKWKWNFDNIIPKAELIFSNADLDKLINLKIIFNGNEGGLVLGNSHSKGGIHLLEIDLDKDKIKYAGEMEGFEYLSSPIKSENHSKELVKLNNLNTEIDISKELVIPKGCRVIDTSNIDVPFILLSGCKQFIINKKSTLNNLIEIIEIEKKY